MMKSRRRIKAFTWVALLFASVIHAQSDAERLMVVTVDDLPYVAGGYPDTVSRAQRTTIEMLSALIEHRVPAVAFVNESKLFVDDQTDARVDLLRQWVESGAILGNHTYSHADLNLLTAEEFEREIVDGEPVLLQLMEPYAPYPLFFRHPQTHTGDTPEKKAAVNGFLRERGYEIAPHTIDGQDQIFNTVYVAAKNSGDSDAASEIQNAYIDFVLAATEFAETIGIEIFGQGIPQTLLIHVNDLNADTLDRLLSEFEQMDYRFIPLGEAMQHAAYQTEDTLVTRFGPTWLWRWNQSVNKGVSFRDDPEAPEWILERFRDLYSRPR